MNKTIVRVVVWGAVAIAVAVVFYFRDSSTKRNVAIDAANALVDEGNSNQKNLGPEVEQFLAGGMPQAFATKSSSSDSATEPKLSADDRAKIDASVARGRERLKKVADCYRAAAEKFAEAAKIGRSETVSHYLDLMAQAYQSRAAAEEARCNAVALLLDKSITTEAELRKRRNALIDQSSKAEQEFDRLEGEAEKLHEEKKSNFN